MPFRQISDIKYYYAESLDNTSLVHAVFTRHGGVSHPPVDSLNVGGTVGDRPEAVAVNLERAFESIGRPVQSLYDVWQVHSAKVVEVDEPRRGEPIIQADVMVTQSPQVTLMMRFADCVPIMAYDPVRRAIGLAHAGWKGTLAKAGPAMVGAMGGRFGSRAEHIHVVLGPSIGPDHYEVGPDVISGVEKVFGQQSECVLVTHNGRMSLDLWAANRLLLQQAGVRQVELARICTACHPEDWFSHRAEKGRTGRFGALIGLND